MTTFRGFPLGFALFEGGNKMIVSSITDILTKERYIDKIKFARIVTANVPDYSVLDLNRMIDKLIIDIEQHNS